jgi:uncharacterized protein (TIGR00251 family)
MSVSRESSLIINVKVIPRAAVSEVAGETGNGVLRVKVHAVPEKGKANIEVCRVLSEYFGVPRSNVEIVSGHTSAQKRVRIVR